MNRGLDFLHAPALATGHENGLHARGTIKELGSDRVVLATTDGKEQTCTLGQDTEFVRGEAPARREEVRARERAVSGHDGSGGAHMGPMGIVMGVMMLAMMVALGAYPMRANDGSAFATGAVSAPHIAAVPAGAGEGLPRVAVLV